MKSRLILIADDNTNNQKLMGDVLQQSGYGVTFASNGKEVLKKLEEIQPDLILMELFMPIMNGLETGWFLKLNPQWKDIPVIYIADKNETESVVEGLKIGAVDYVTKPFNSEELSRRVKIRLDLKRSQNQLRKTNQELQRRNTTKDQFFSIISHDLRSPFQGLIGLTEFLHNDIERMGKDDIVEFTTMIHESARNLLNLLDNLLEWSILDRDKQYFEPGNSDIKQIIDKNIRLYSANTTRKKITITNQIDEPVHAWVDYNMIDTVVRNLISNAIKFTPEGGSIDLSVEKNPPDIILRISDSGIGIDKKTMESLFQIENVHSRPGTSNEKGTGLGLLICKELIEKNNGSIRVTSKPDGGTEISIQIPSARINHQENNNTIMA